MNFQYKAVKGCYLEQPASLVAKKLNSSSMSTEEQAKWRQALTLLNGYHHYTEQVWGSLRNNTGGGCLVDLFKVGEFLVCINQECCVIYHSEEIECCENETELESFFYIYGNQDKDCIYLGFDDISESSAVFVGTADTRNIVPIFYHMESESGRSYLMVLELTTTGHEEHFVPTIEFYDTDGTEFRTALGTQIWTKDAKAVYTSERGTY